MDEKEYKAEKYEVGKVSHELNGDSAAGNQVPGFLEGLANTTTPMRENAGHEGEDVTKNMPPTFIQGTNKN